MLMVDDEGQTQSVRILMNISATCMSLSLSAAVHSRTPSSSTTTVPAGDDGARVRGAPVAHIQQPVFWLSERV